MRARLETVRTVFFDMPADQAENILEGITQHLAKCDRNQFDEDDGIQTMFEFRDKLANILGKHR